MPISIPVITKVKPVQLNPLKGGQRQIAIDKKGAMMLTELKNNLEVISKTIKAAETDEELDPNGSSISALIVLDCKTISDQSLSDFCLFFSEAKAGSFKNSLKEVEKVVKKGDKQIATCDFKFNGKKNGNNLVLGIDTISACKMKLTPVTKWLTKLGKPYGIQFEEGIAMPVVVEETVEETATESIDTPSGTKKTLLEQLVERLEAAEVNYIENPNPGYLKMWGKILAKLKELLSKKPGDELIKQTFKEWLAKYNAAKSGDVEEATNEVVDQVVEDEDEATIALREKIQGLEDRLDEVKANNSLGLDELVNEYSFLMGTCQQIGATPNYKAILKRTDDLKEQFTRVLDGATAEIMNNQDLKKELMRQIKETAKVGEQFKAEAEQLWDDFRNYTKTIVSPLDAQAALEKVQKEVKAFQQKVEQRSRGLILLSKKANVGNAVKISEHMTAVRSRATKLKNAIQEQLKVVDNHLKLMQELMDKFHKSFDPNVITEINSAVSDFRKLSLDL